MGLITAAISSVAGTLADQWKEFFYCEALPANVLVRKASHTVKKGSSNRFGDDNIITTGSGIVVADGQCMIIVDQGKVVEICAEPGEYTYDASSEPSIFTGDLAANIPQILNNLANRFTHGGQVAKDQRVYYFNTKEIIGNKYGTPSPIPFRVVDQNIGLDADISIRCFGEYSYRITNPVLFYTNVCGNIAKDYTRDQIDSQLKSELLTALQPAFAKISNMGIRYSALPAHTTELADALNDVLSGKWGELRGVEIVSLGINSVTATEEDEAMIKELQKNAVFRNPNMAAAQLVGAQSAAMQSAAKNEGTGAAMAFMGMNMASQAGGASAQDLFAMGQQAAAAAAPAAAQGWTCVCGQTGNTGKFCTNCGQPKPDQKGWTCSCGTVNLGRFCTECGKPKPAGEPLYKCDKCGWEPEDPKNPPKFCPECGDPFDDNDVQ